ncbi:MAG: hypothetical protein QM680_10065 [Luteolibacter sp.]
MIKTVFASFLLAPFAHGALIVVDYSYADYLNQLQPGSAGRAAIDQAAADISSLLVNHHLAAVPTRSAYGSASWNNGEFDLVSSISLSASYLVKNPTSVSDYARLSNETFSENEFRIYVGMSMMNSGYASSSAAVVGISQFGYGYVPSWEAALREAEANANTLLGRSNPVIASNWNASMPYGSVSGEYSIAMGPTAGSIGFNSSEYWHYDASTPVREGYYDFYSVALQEMLRNLGVTPSEAIQRGARYQLTAADISALSANGWTVVPEPSAFLISFLSIPLLILRKRP